MSICGLPDPVVYLTRAGKAVLLRQADKCEQSGDETAAAEGYYTRA